MKNRRNIVEQKYPPENPNDIWLKDGKFYHSTSEGWTVIDSEMEYTNKTSMIADKPKGGTIGINKETGEPSIYNDVTKQWNPLSGGVNIITWQELKDKRDAGKLTPGSLYRITDYNCTTTQENTQSAGHQFDIVLLALSENKLAEEGWAMEHPTDVYDVTFGDGVTKKCYIYEDPNDEGMCYLVDCETKLGCPSAGTIEIGAEIIINIEDKTAICQPYLSSDLITENLTYNYFQNSNLSAWKVWYCLDNDKSRFAWADDNVIGDIENIVVHYLLVTFLGETTPAHDAVYTLTNETQIVRGVTYFKLLKLEGNGYNELFVNTKNIDTKTTLYEIHSAFGNTNANAIADGSIKSINYNTPPTEKGRGVIYRLIDEWNNDIPYDFKNIQYIRKLTDGHIKAQGSDTWCYTFNAYFNGDTYDYSIVSAIWKDDEDDVLPVMNNTIYSIKSDNGGSKKLNNFVFNADGAEPDVYGVVIKNNLFLMTGDGGNFEGTALMHSIFLDTINNIIYNDSTNGIIIYRNKKVVFENIT